MSSTEKTKPAARKTAAKSADKPAAKSPAKGAAKGRSAAPEVSAATPVYPTRPVKPVTADKVDATLSNAAETPVAQGGKAAQALRLKGLVDEVSARTGAKKPEVKAVIEAALAHIGEALARGEGFTLPGLGKGKVAKTKAVGEGEVITLKLKRGAEKNANTPLAAADD